MFRMVLSLRQRRASVFSRRRLVAESVVSHRAAIVSQAQSSTHTHARITQVYYWHASSSPPSTAFRASSVAPGKQ